MPRLAALSTLFLFAATRAAPAPPPTSTVIPASVSPNVPLWNINTPVSSAVPQPVRGGFGAGILAQQNVPIGLQNPDLFAPPTTDHGVV